MVLLPRFAAAGLADLSSTETTFLEELISLAGARLGSSDPLIDCVSRELCSFDMPKVALVQKHSLPLLVVQVRALSPHT